MSIRSFRLATLVALLLALAGISSAAPPTNRPAPTAAQKASWAKMSEIAKTRDRDAKGRFLPKVSNDAVGARAFSKFEERNRAAGHQVDGHSDEDWATAKRELQEEKAAQNRAMKIASQK